MAAPIALATTAVAPTHARPCRSNDDCGANHTGGLCVAKPVTKGMSDAEDFLERAMSLHDLVTSLGDRSSSSPIMTILQRVREDLTTRRADPQARRLPRARRGRARPKSGAGAVILYLGSVLKTVNDATSGVNAFLNPDAIPQLENDLTLLSQGHDLVGKDGNPGTCLERRDTFGH